MKALSNAFTTARTAERTDGNLEEIPQVEPAEQTQARDFITLQSPVCRSATSTAIITAAWRGLKATRGTRRIKMAVAAVLACIPLLAACGPDPLPPVPPVPPVPPGPTATTTTTAEGKKVSPEQIEQAMDNFAQARYEPMAQEIFNFWTAQYRLWNLRNTKTQQSITSSVKVVYLSKKNPSYTCGTKREPMVLTTESAVGPAYCLGGVDTVVIPLSMTRKLTAGQEVALNEGTMQLSPSQEVGVFFLLAHELGHNVQEELMGTAALKLANDVAVENAADCLGGVAIAGVERMFSNKDVATILRMAGEIGQPQGVDHGTAQQRQEAVAYGMLNRPYNSAAVNRGIVDCFQKYLPGAISFS